MDRRTLLAVFLSVGIYYAWLILRGPVALPPEAAMEPVAAQVGVEAPGTPPRPVPAGPIRSDLPVRDVPLAACGVEGRWTTDGGHVRDLALVGHEEPYAVDPIWSWVSGLVTGGSELPWRPYGGQPGRARLLSADARALSVGAGPLDQAPVRMEVRDERSDGVVLRGTTAQGIVVEERVTAEDLQPCRLLVQVTWSNPTAVPFDGPMWLGVHDRVPEAASGMLDRYKSIERPVLMADGSVEHVEPTTLDEAGGQEAYEGPVSWFGLADRYFGFLVVPAEEDGALFGSTRHTPDATLYGAHYVAMDSLAPGATRTFSFEVFMGPLDVDILEQVDDDLTEIVDYGWFAFFAHPLLWLLEVFHAGLKNWGLAIIALTFTVKTIFFPLTQSSLKSGQAMQAIQPKLQEIREQFKDKPDQLNQKTMELFRESGVNPLGGCLPMLVQMPIWIALYNVLLSSVELYHTEFLWLRDLSSADPTGILPAIVVVLMMVQQSFTPMGNLDPVQQRVMRVMPLVFGIFFFTFPSGLVVYIFVNMVLSILQQWVIKRTFTLPPATTA